MCLVKARNDPCQQLSHAARGKTIRWRFLTRPMTNRANIFTCEGILEQCFGWSCLNKLKPITVMVIYVPTRFRVTCSLAQKHNVLLDFFACCYFSLTSKWKSECQEEMLGSLGKWLADRNCNELSAASSIALAELPEVSSKIIVHLQAARWPPDNECVFFSSYANTLSFSNSSKTVVHIDTSRMKKM